MLEPPTIRSGRRQPALPRPTCLGHPHAASPASAPASHIAAIDSRMPRTRVAGTLYAITCSAHAADRG